MKENRVMKRYEVCSVDIDQYIYQLLHHAIPQIIGCAQYSWRMSLRRLSFVVLMQQLFYRMAKSFCRATQ